MPDDTNMVIESLGVYLPPNSYSTSDIMDGCSKQIRFPLEKITGIKNRRMAGQEEFAIDLARNAITDCLKTSSYAPEDIDLLICCNISRFDSPKALSFEPCTAIKLRKHFGFDNAIAFDITNACAGMFTGIYIVQDLLKTGAIRRGMVVSGEYITHLTKTAQREIESFMDTKIACLTLGDAGAAIILENGNDPKIGFQQIDLQTFGRYSPYCIAKWAESGGFIMLTDSVNLTDVAIKSGAKYALDVLQQSGWPTDSFQHLIMHQTSRMTLNSAKNEINGLVKEEIIHSENMVNNLDERGNTASTSHFVALADQIRTKNIQSGDRVVFSVSASGLTVGTALYVFDDLPDRLLSGSSPSAAEPKTAGKNSTLSDQLPGVRIASIGTLPEEGVDTTDSMELVFRAAKSCLGRSAYQANDIGLLIHTGVYRSEYLMEPAYAALLAGKLDMNATLADQENQKTLAFDIFNGSMGFLNACYAAQQMIASGNCEQAMITASETENNADSFSDNLLGIRETGSAIILDKDPMQKQGFRRIVFDYQSGSIDDYTAYCSTLQPQAVLHMNKAPDLEDKYLACIIPVVEDILQQEGLSPDQVTRIFPPQISTSFIDQLSHQLGLPREQFVNAVGEGPELFSSSLPYSLDLAMTQQLVEPGDIGLLIAVGSGIQVGCALYQF